MGSLILDYGYMKGGQMCDNITEQSIYEEGACQGLGTSDAEPQKIQYILDENGELAEIPKDKCIPVEHPIKCRLVNAFEVFVRVKNTDNYWISNYGRLVNNLNRKDKSTFYEHRQGNRHYTVYEIEKSIVSFPFTVYKNGKVKIDRTQKRMERQLSSDIPDKERDRILSELQEGSKTRIYEIQRDRWRRETSTEELVAQHFLVCNGRCRIWHKDGDVHNNWYKNLIYVTGEQFKELKAGKITWQELNLEQEYVEYENRASMAAYIHYNALQTRCKETKNIDRIGKHYADTVMCQEWQDNPRSFVKWYWEHYYYSGGGESMAVDKDLFGGGSHIYSPETCCILPQGLNTLLSNCKKPYYNGKTPETSLPMGVRYNGKDKKYYGEIRLSGTDEQIKLSEWDTPEEAFEEYKTFKQADVLISVLKYKDRIPDYIYKKFLDVEIQPY